ncbi:MAG: hypothetical protein ACOX3Q_11250 [Clostridia bacterium]|jgi:hypothetical protein
MMKKIYHDVLFDEYGNSIPLSADEYIEYLLESIYRLREERDLLKNQLAEIQSILNPTDSAIDY